ncbi:unnamed protein product [Kluyveromyces dobzhanskii CBS 2104]|uniref:WGS project CCBQ000000000 data, contig 00098 n=1 Tax=Kluyveromyces dobzhanskii CBS 2104 TaxID=1427455 RepID=A0A0A8L5R1_9SACH|nr:unnamed protein product [Kluyveromyces dobzhanskii CBS 2104]
MGSDKRPQLRKQQTDDDSALRGRSVTKSHSSGASNLFFRSSSASNLFKLRNSLGNGSGSSSSNSVAAAGTKATANEDVPTGVGDGVEMADTHHMVDVLPSFEMYNALHRNIPRGNVNPDQHDLPPGYQEVQSRVLFPDLCDGTTVSQLDDTYLTPPERSLSETNLGGVGSSQSLQSMTSGSSMVIRNSLQTLNTRYEAIIDDLNDSDNINIEKLYSLPKVSTPIDANIRILKKATKPYQEKPEEESILKEYTSGDIINGYVVIENRSQHPLRFEMIYVTLEGCACVIDKKQGKRTVKRFLRMVDLSASWSYSNIDLATGFQYTPGDIDYDGCVLGLNNDRSLLPGVRYKKFFTFKFPNQLLDISCKHEIFCHCLLPPSFGVDKYKDHARYSNIKLNSMLGYGHLGTKGSPILTNDLCSDHLSVSYTIDARVVGKDVKSHELTIMKEKEYNLRLIPFGFCQPLTGDGDPIVLMRKLQTLVEERMDALERVFKKLEIGECITANDIHSTDLSGTIDYDTNVDSEEILTRKLNQLRISNRIDPDAASFPVRNVKTFKKHENTIVSEFPYTIKGKSKSRSKLKKGIFSSLYGGSSAATETETVPPVATDSPQSGISAHSSSANAPKCGIIMLECKVPEDGLPYIGPSLLKKTNQYKNKNKHDQSNWDAIQSPLLDEEKKVLEHLKLHLRCIQANSSVPHQPPEIQSVTTQLVCITGKAVSSFPLKLNTKLLLNTEKMNSIRATFQEYLQRAKEYKKKFKENIDQLTELYNKSRSSMNSQQEIRFTDFLTPQFMNDIESLASLAVDIKFLNHIFKKQDQTLPHNPDRFSSITNSFHAESVPTGLQPSSSQRSHLSLPQLMKQELLHDWIESDEKEYNREVTVNIMLDTEIKETLVPTFESCLCCRMYCIRVNVKFENNIGSASIDVPIRIRNLEC